MQVYLQESKLHLESELTISGSKSESNRVLIFEALHNKISIRNLSDSDDTKHLQHALTTTDSVINIGHAGTAMRFLTAYFAVKEGSEITLTGSDRMQNRPIKILVDALRDLGASIRYLDKEGYAPLLIKGMKIIKSNVEIAGDVSSQYISALALIGSSLKNGLEIQLIGKVTSIPYINMTISLLQNFGVSAAFLDNKITVKPYENKENKTVVVESDWSSASYFYSLIALSEIGTQIKLSSYKEKSLQGDSCLSSIYADFGVKTTFLNDSILLKKESNTIQSEVFYDLVGAPDIAQTIAVTCFGLGVACTLKGLHTLKIKETDRLVALQNELSKLGSNITITDASLHLSRSTEINKNISIATYSDHRMAMAFVPLALKTEISIEDADVVTKSYTNFWNDMQKIGLDFYKK